MKLTVQTFLTLDGVMQAPGGPEEDPSGGFEHGGWLVPHADAEMGAFMDETFAGAEAFLLGRFTYQTFAAHWPRVDPTGDTVATKLNTLPKHVASRTLREEDLDWEGATLLGDDVPARVAELKQRPGGELQVHGSAGLVQTLHEHDLIDELRLWIFPIVLGTGKRFFGAGTTPGALELISSGVTKTGVTVSNYRRAGRIETGSMDFDEPTEAELERRRRLAGA